MFLWIFKVVLIYIYTVIVISNTISFYNSIRKIFDAKRLSKIKRLYVCMCVCVCVCVCLYIRAQPCLV